MKVAVCVSGVARGEVDANIALMKKHFPFDFFYATWNNQSSNLENCYHYSEPSMFYHPIRDIVDTPAPKLAIQKHQLVTGQYDINFYQRTLNHTKQILIHDMLLKDIPQEYNMIIRARFDTRLSTKVDFTKYLEMSYNDNLAVGFGTRTSRHSNYNVMREIPKIYPNGNDDVSQDWGWYLMDPLIFHPRKLWNHDLVTTLHNNKQLKAAEWGWYQILSEPYKDNHMCVYGGAQIEKYLK